MTPSRTAVVLDVPRGDTLIATRPAARPRSRRRAQPWVRHHVLGEALFKEALVRERKRADRLDQPLAVLLLGPSATHAGAGGWASILRTLAAVKRDGDLVGWFEQGAVLGLLLPETTGTGALAVRHRLARDVAGRAAESALVTSSSRVFAYGAHSALPGNAVPSVDLLLDDVTEQRHDPWQEAAKRGLDILGSLLLLALFAPLLLAIFVVVKWTSPGPSLFRQVRVGRGGEPFTMLKFRTMYADAGHGVHQEYVTWFIKSSGRQPCNGHDVFKLTNDTRITPAGRFLRRTSLDELPQFWNVLRGDMSLVGPRPPLPFEVEQYEPWHRRRVLEAKPGVTGPWQVFGRSRTTFDEMVRLDLRYARTHCLWTDIKILAATPHAMVSGKGAC
jgi:lipopolysaccharide/colanic/teichoic acid biosynthesis glycosyltransferase